jgi:hypothetical protein
VIVLNETSVEFTFTTSVTAMELPGARDAAVHVIVPVPPGLGALQVCAGPAAEKPTHLNVVPVRDRVRNLYGSRRIRYLICNYTMK